ncbi:N-acetyllactosaminide beta-1 6-N-acetylglucosaminyl-transferase [Paragonimus heterotremus]|uniref:N-acetyllactosaminide beta-1 6-N-acetylglucosaminyl-transferase n=1 Tax=Paragonimus heterotremus TaxID=100268 RepID=A0A8J4T242_9TREM|nr:N-acetyllactosaminide beta-1 6-N-acetylglucosaminyl-transferase [Paragonimus heterotremus]
MQRPNSLLRCLWTLLAVSVIVLVMRNARPKCEVSVRAKASMDEPNELVRHNHTLHSEERSFPLAFSILVHRDLDRVLRLLNAIHRPHNCYCIHVDRKTTHQFRTAIEQAVRKQYGTEVFVVPEAESLDVRWGMISVLDADLLCSRILLNRCSDWTYWINLTGQEFPLRTNWELVTALKLLNGSNMIAGSYKHRITSRLPQHVRLNFTFTWFKGSVHIAARREFVQFMLTDIKAKQILKVLREHEREVSKVTVPDETYFATINHNPGSLPVPGAFLQGNSNRELKQVTRYKVWARSHQPCGSGRWRRSICMFGLKDLPRLIDQPEFFANKFVPEVEPEAYDILELWLAHKVDYETRHAQLHPSFKKAYYSSLESSWRHL